HRLARVAEAGDDRHAVLLGMLDRRPAERDLGGVQLLAVAGGELAGRRQQRQLLRLLALLDVHALARREVGLLAAGGPLEGAAAHLDGGVAAVADADGDRCAAVQRLVGERQRERERERERERKRVRRTSHWKTMSRGFALSASTDGVATFKPG